MKKYFVMAVLVLMIFPLMVFADAAGPGFQSYQAIVKNDGVKIYDFDRWDERIPEIKGEIKKGSKVEVDYEYEVNGEVYGEVYYNNEMRYIKISDLMLANATFDMSKASKLTYEVKGHVYKDGVYLYKGPSMIYEKVDGNAIPVGTDLTYEYFDIAEGAEPMWVYTTYNGKSGWVYVYQYENVFYEDASGIASIPKKGSKLINVNESVNLYVSPKASSSKITVDMPMYQELGYSYMFGIYCYVTYQGKSGWIKTSNRFDDGEPFDGIVKNENEDGFIVLNKQGVNTYTKLLDFSSKTSTTIPYDTMLKYNFSFYKYVGDSLNRWFLVDYDGQKLWLQVSSEDSSLAFETYLKDALIAGKQVKIYKEPSTLANSIDSLDWNKSVEVKYEFYKSYNEGAWYYIVYDKNKKGWLENKNLAFKNEIDVKALIDNPLGVDIYTEPSNEKTIIGKIPNNTEINRSYFYKDSQNQSWFYVKYDGKTGWYKDNQAKEEYVRVSDKYRTRVPFGLLCYKTPSTNSQEAGLIPYGTKLEAMYSYDIVSTKEKWLYVTYENGTGWILNNEASIRKITDEEFYKEDEKTEPSEVPLPSKKPDDTKNKSNLTPTQIILISVGSAVILALTAFVSIKLINKKKKNKEEGIKFGEKSQDKVETDESDNSNE